MDHISGLYSKAGYREFINDNHRYGNYWMFNQNISGNAEKSKIMHMKTPNNKKLIISDSSLKDNLENKRQFANPTKFELKLAYVRLNDGEIIWRHEINDESVKREGELFTLDKGKLTIYQNPIDKLEEELNKEEDEEKKLELKDTIEELKEKQKEKFKLNIKLVFEDMLNRDYIVHHVDKNGEDILEPTRIKGLDGVKFEVKPANSIYKDGKRYLKPSPVNRLVDFTSNTTSVPILVFKYAEEVVNGKDPDDNKNIPGYDEELNKIQEKTGEEESSKNNQSKQNKDQVKLQVRHIGLNVCRVPNCKEHTTIASKYSLGLIERGHLISEMFVDKNMDINVALKPYLDKYAGGIINGYGLQFGSKIEVPPKEATKDTIVKFNSGSNDEIYVNLYEYYSMPHSGVKDIEYRVNHVIHGRKKATEDGKPVEYDGTYTNSEGKPVTYPISVDIKMPFKTDNKGNLNAPSMVFTNFIYKMWDRYEGFVVSEDRENQAFDKLVISKKNKFGNTMTQVDVFHNGDLKEKELKKISDNKYEFNFIKTSSKDWYEYIYAILDGQNTDNKISLYTIVKPVTNDNAYRDITFDYYFTGPNIPIPDYKTADYIVRFLDQDGNKIMPDLKNTLEVGTEVNISETKELFGDYEYFKTEPKKEKLTIVEDSSKNIITHYYYNKDTHIPVRYHANEGKFGTLENAYPGSDENTRIVLAKKSDFAKDHNPGDISRPGFAFVDWTNDKEHLKPIGESTVGELDNKTENGVKYVNIYAQWRGVVDPKVTFHGNGGNFEDNTTTKTFTAKAGRTIGSYVPSGLRRSGYNFTKWTDGLDGNEMVASYVLQEKDHIHIYANWKLDDYVAPVDPPTRPPVDPPVSPPVGPEIIPGGGEDDIIPPEDFELIEIMFPDIPLGNKLNMIDHFAYIFGYPNVTVRPENNISREEAAAVFYRLLRPAYKDLIYSKDKSFKDVGETRWSFDNIATLNKGQIVSGYMDQTFRPKNNVTRAEIAVMASRFENLKYDGVNKFKDVENHWAKHYINSAAMNGWIVGGGSNENFRPDDYMTRAEFVTMVNNVLKRKVRKENALEGIKKFSDLQEDKWYYEPMIEAINGHDYEKERLEDGSEIWIKLLD